MGSALVRAIFPFFLKICCLGPSADAASKMWIGHQKKMQTGGNHEVFSNVLDHRTQFKHMGNTTKRFPGKRTSRLIGNGATLNDGVILGELSIVASGAVVLENKEFPPKSFVVGIPAAAREQQTTEDHHKRIKRTAENYARKAQLFKEDGLGGTEINK